MSLKVKYGKAFLIIVALIALGTALAHLSCIFIGSQCYSAQMAPSQIIESAKNGTLIAPMGTIIISSIFIIWGLYALSGAQVIRKLLLLKVGIDTIATLCIIRDLSPMQLWARHPDRVEDLILCVGLAWLVTGLLYFLAFVMFRQSTYNKELKPGLQATPII